MIQATAIVTPYNLYALPENVDSFYPLIIFFLIAVVLFIYLSLPYGRLFFMFA